MDHLRLQIALFTVWNFLPNDKMLDLSKLKVLANFKISVIQQLKFDLGKGENAGIQQFPFFPQSFLCQVHYKCGKG